MSFDFKTNFYELSLNYKALVTQEVYNRGTVITNSNRSPELSGRFLETTPVCFLDSKVTIDQWYDSTTGVLALFHVFDRAPITAGRFRMKAIASANGRIELVTQTLAVDKVTWLDLPYKIIQAVPLTVLDDEAVYSIANDLMADTFPGQEVNVQFGFYVTPKENVMSYTRNSFSSNEFISVRSPLWS